MPSKSDVGKLAEQLAALVDATKKQLESVSKMSSTERTKFDRIAQEAKRIARDAG